VIWGTYLGDIFGKSFTPRGAKYHTLRGWGIKLAVSVHLVPTLMSGV